MHPPEYKDIFMEVRQVLEEWNSSVFENFVPGWITCLDESMMKYIN